MITVESSSVLIDSITVWTDESEEMLRRIYGSSGVATLMLHTYMPIIPGDRVRQGKESRGDCSRNIRVLHRNIMYRRANPLIPKT